MTGPSGLSRCPTCSRVFLTNSAAHIYCTPACRKPKPLHPVGPRTFTCGDCGIEALAGKHGPLPRRCDECKRRWDGRPERLEAKRRRAKEKK